MVSPGCKIAANAAWFACEPGMRLHVRHTRRRTIFSHDRARDVFHLIDKLAAAVITLARIAFRVLVGEHAASGFKDRLRREVLTRNQLEMTVLAIGFFPDQPVNIGIDFGPGDGPSGCS